MAEIRHEEIYCNALGRRLVRVTKYMARTKQFTIELPAEVAALSGKTHVQGSDESKAVEEWKSVMDEYKARQIKKRKIIVVTFEGDAMIQRNGKVVFRSEDRYYRNTGQIVFTLEYHVCDETLFRGQIEYIRLDGERTTVDKRKDKIIDWTQEREDYFKGVKFSLEEMILSANAFFSQSNKMLTSRIDGVGIRALPFSGVQNKKGET